MTDTIDAQLVALDQAEGFNVDAWVDEAIDALMDEATAELLTPDDWTLLERELTRRFEAPEFPGLLPHQVPPPGNWRTWVLFGGRGSGKTQGAAMAYYDHIFGPPCDSRIPGGHRPGILAPTLGDAVSSCIEGPSGLRALDPGLHIATKLGGTWCTFTNGVAAQVFGGYTRENAERFRAKGSNLCFIWIEEMAAIRQLAAAWTQMRLGLRLGSSRIIASTTPRTRPIVKQIIEDPRTVVTHGTTDDNPHLDPDLRAELRSIYAGTRVERQELEGLLLETVEGALWSEEDIDLKRINLRGLHAEAPQQDDETKELWLRRVLRIATLWVCLDPATSGRGDETGIVVVGRGRLTAKGPANAFVLEDATFLADAAAWAARAVEVAIRWQANAMLVEKNRLGTTAATVIRGAGYLARIDDFDAKTSKFNRADPVKAAWAPRCWIVGSLPKLENQMASWVPDDEQAPTEPDPNNPDAFGGSPDALDAMVYGVRKALGIVDQPRPVKKPGRPTHDRMLEAWNQG